MNCCCFFRNFIFFLQTNLFIHNNIVQREEIQHVETELIEKEEILNDNIKEIAELDETLLLLDDERKLLQSELKDTGTTNTDLHTESTSTHALDVSSNPANIDSDNLGGHLSDEQGNILRHILIYVENNN